MKTLKLFLLLIVCVVFQISAQQVNGVAVHSQKMNIDVKNTIIIPEGYDKNDSKTYPVLYLLHGYSGNETSWIGIKNNLPQLASDYGMIIVCPDGKNSWYWDSPIDPKSQYETYVSKELVEYMDKNYKTVQSPKGRAVTGLSMGGHGGLWLGINHPDVFSACGSMSGGVDIRPFQNNWEMSKALGAYKDNKELWDNHTVITQLSKITLNTLSIIIDCGFDDFFFDVNENLHKEMLLLKIPHDYITRPGAHNGEYWNNAIDYQLLFFSKVFKKTEEVKK